MENDDEKEILNDYSLRVAAGFFNGRIRTSGSSQASGNLVAVNLSQYSWNY
jgi:hypothetical protein